MGLELGMASPVPSLPPPCPRSPPPYPDLYGKRRELAKLQMLEREKGFLEEELKFVEGLQPASRCCKEIVDFVAAKSDPFVPTNQKITRSCGFWKWLCGSCCYCFSWLCRCTGCSFHLKPSDFRCCNPCSGCRSFCTICSLPKWQCCCSCPPRPCCCRPPRPCCCCCTKISCHKSRCRCKIPSCFISNCCHCRCSCPKPQDLCVCFSCRKNCCDPTCCICY
ncbi:hypothetical protein Dimus_025861 [Dionaea muscipula]